jgi:ribosomal protein L10
MEGDSKSKNISKLGEVIFQGNTIIGITKEDPKEIAKAFKKNEIPLNIKEFFLNLILTKCAAKALDLEDQIHLPFHVPLPKVKLQEKKD